MDRRERLEQLRDQLTAAMVDAEPRALAGLSRELRLTLSELEALPGAGRVTTRDDIAAARRRRRSVVGE